MLLKMTRAGLLATLLPALMLAWVLVPTGTTVRAATPTISLSHGTVPQGATLVVSGTGFTANDSILSYVDTTVNGKTQRSQVTGSTDQNGNFSVKLALPRYAAANIYTVKAQDSHGLSSSAKVNVRPLIVLQNGKSGAKISVLDRTGFFVNVLGMKASETVKIDAAFPTYSGNQIVETHTPTANASGNVFWVSFYTPRGAKAAAGTITAVGQTSNGKATGHVAVFYRPYIVVSKAVAPGQNLTVMGHGFVSNGQVKLQITIKANDGSTPTLTVTASPDNNGNFTQTIHIPSYAVAGTYPVTAIGLDLGAKFGAKAIVSQFNAFLALLPNVTLPNNFVTASGSGFPANAGVTVTASINLTNGNTRNVSKTVTTDSGGTFATDILVPGRASPGTYSFSATSESASATAHLQVLPLSAHPANLGFSWVSLWYHTVRQGTWDELVVQSTLHTTLGIWVHVIFPNGLHHDYYKGTNSGGRWSVKFSVPSGSASRHSNQAYITIQLWHGKQTAQKFMNFTLV